jgi:hypothetical protein
MVSKTHTIDMAGISHGHPKEIPPFNKQPSPCSPMYLANTPAPRENPRPMSGDEGKDDAVWWTTVL